MKHVIIGGVAGGATAAARIRRIDEKAEITLIEKNHHISYANCGLPYYLGGVITERQKLFVKTAQDFKQRFNIDVKLQHEALSIDTKAKTILVRDAFGYEKILSYDKLLLSPGANPVKPPLKGIDLPGIFTLRSVGDTDQIKAYIEKHEVKRAVVVGAGFIGMEMAENFKQKNIDVTVIEMANQVMGPLDFCMAALVQRSLKENGIHLMMNKQVCVFKSNNEVLTLEFKSGEKMDTDLVILSIGVRPQTELAVQAGLKIGETGGIWVNQFLQTSDKDIYAVGDAIEFPHPITKKPWLNYLAGPANRQARLVATNMVRGNEQIYEGSIGTSIAKIFDLTAASTGFSSKVLRKLNIPFLASTTCSDSNAGYYPGASRMMIKMLYSPRDGRIYGAQIVGQKGVDKRIDQIALLIKLGGKVNDLMELEHAYAPPFSSAKDPIAIAGYVATNVLTKEMPILTWKDMYQSIHGEGKIKDLTIVDLRTVEEYENDTIEGTVNIPLDELRNRLDELNPNQPILVFCMVGRRGYLGQKILFGNGFKKVYNLTGGMKLYEPAVAAYEENN